MSNVKVNSESDKKAVYVVFFQTSTMPAKIVRFFTGYKLNHSSIAFDPSLEPMYSFGRKTVNNFLNGGFVLEHLNKGVFEKFNNTQIVVCKINVPVFQYLLLKESVQKFCENKELKYNFIGAILLPLGIGYAPKNKYTCSQFIGEVFTHSGIAKFDKFFSLVTPKDLLEYLQVNFKDEFNVIYSGQMSKYHT